MRFNDRLTDTKSKAYAAMRIAAVSMGRDKAFKNMFQKDYHIEEQFSPEVISVCQQEHVEKM